MTRLLLIEDEDVIRKQLVRMLERNRYSVCAAATVQQAVAMDLQSFDLVLSDIRLPGAAGTDIIALAEPIPVIIMTSYASVRSAVDAMKLGAVDYISKPFDHDELLLLIERSLQSVKLSAQNVALKDDVNRFTLPPDCMDAESPMQQVVATVREMPRDDGCLCFAGEQGSGREWLARIAHTSGSRSSGPLVFSDGGSTHVQASSQPLFASSLLKQARGGTLVIRNLERIGDSVQRALIGGVQEADVSLIAICENEPASYVPADVTGLVNVTILLPALRERRVDIPLIAAAFLQAAMSRYGRPGSSLGRDALSMLQAYDWPGNISELRNVIERAVLLADGREIGLADLGLGITAGNPVVSTGTDIGLPELNLDEYFRYVVLQSQDLLSETQLAARLGISRKALWERRQRMGLNRR